MMKDYEEYILLKKVPKKRRQRRTLAITCTDDIYYRFREHCEKEHRTLRSVIRKLIEDYVEKNNA